MKRTLGRLGWGWIGFAIMVMLVFGGIRIAQTLAASPPTDAFAVRYVEHPFVAFIHILPGLVFLVFVPLQFIKKIRRTRIGFHRRTGWMLVPLAAVSGVYAIVAAFTLPAFGGVPTVAATVVFGLTFLYSLVRAVRHIRRREVALHREWMIRMFSLALGVATIRAVQGLAQAFLGTSLEGSFGASFWIAFTLNLGIAEMWIRFTRPRSRTHLVSPAPAPART
jgi:uncharacterized membrane protein